jgi:hypothetical protein
MKLFFEKLGIGIEFPEREHKPYVITDKHVKTLVKRIGNSDPEMQVVMRGVAESWVEKMNSNGWNYLADLTTSLDGLFKDDDRNTYLFNWKFWGKKIGDILGMTYGNGSASAVSITKSMIQKGIASDKFMLIRKLETIVENAPETRGEKYYDPLAAEYSSM